MLDGDFSLEVGGSWMSCSRRSCRADALLVHAKPRSDALLESIRQLSLSLILKHFEHPARSTLVIL